MNQEYPYYMRVAAKLLLIGLVIAFLVAGKVLLIPLTIATFFTFLLLPISRKLESWRVPRAVAIIISIACALAFFGALFYFLYSQFLSFADDWPELRSNIVDKLAQLQQLIFKKLDISLQDQERWLDQKMEQASGSGEEILMTMFSATGAFLANLALIPIYIFFMTYYRGKIMEFITMISSNPDKGMVREVTDKVTVVSQKYLKGLFWDIMILTVLNSTGFLVLGLKHAILFGLLASILNIIPYIGVLIGSLLPILMALLTKDEIGYALGVLGVCVVVQFLDNNIITPYVVGSSVSINPLTATIVLVTGALVWGVFGMILCLPLTGMAKVICDNVEALKPYGYLIGEEVNYQGRGIHHRLKKH